MHSFRGSRDRGGGWGGWGGNDEEGWLLNDDA